MADDKNTGRSEIPADELDGGAEGEVDVLFRTQMQITNFLLGYWKHLLLALFVFLGGVYAYATWQEQTRDSQRAIQAEIAQIDRDMPEPDQLYAMGLGPMDDPKDEQRRTELQAAASRYEEVAKDGSGSGAVSAWLKAAETWTRAQEPEKAKAAWKAAYDLKPAGSMGWAATAGLAAATANSGDVDGAAALYQSYADGHEGYDAERALFELGKLYEGAGRTAESKKVYEDFAARHPDSALFPRVEEAARRVRDAG